MAQIYESEFALTGSADGPIEGIEVKNPADSGTDILILRLGVVANASFAPWVIRRYSGHLSHGSGGDAPSLASVYKRDSAFAASPILVYVAASTASLDSTGLTLSYEHTESLDPSDAGDDAEIILAKYAEDFDTLIVRPGESLTIEAPQADLEFRVNVTWEDRRTDTTITHLASGALPAAGAKTDQDPIEFLSGESKIAFWTTITRASGYLGAVAFEVEWSTGMRVATQSYGTITPDTDSAVGTVLEFDIPTGATSARLLVSEQGDPAHPSTVAIDAFVM